MKKIFSVLCVLFCVVGCALNPKEESVKSRQSAFAKTQLNTKKSVEVLWNDFGVPRISAQTDEDLFYTVGALQMHLRRSQLEFLRMISQGRVSEMMGGSTKDLDHFLKSMNFPEIAKRNWDLLSEESKLTLAEMARGMNDYIKQNPKRAADLKLAGVKPQEWTALDLATIHRFIAVDINWMMFARVLKFSQKPYYKKLWQSWTEQKSFLQLLLQDQKHLQSFNNNLDVEDFVASQKLASDDGLEKLTQFFTKAGSNAFAVGKKKTGGAAVLSNDPHLGIMIPNLWVFMVVESPSFNSMGFMMPTFPLPAVGRNHDIAWGGTNMWSISTHLNQVTEAELESATQRQEVIRVRLGRDKKITIREIAGRPIVSDIPMFAYAKPLALYWVGMEPSDEVLAFLNVNRAKNWNEFQNAFETYATSGQNFLYADKQGNVGKVAAFKQLQVEGEFELPRPAYKEPKVFKNVKQLPQSYNPNSGFVVSANESLQSEGKTPISLFHAPKERVNRMAKLLEDSKTVGLPEVKNIQLDVFSQSAMNLAEVILSTIANHSDKEALEHESYQKLKAWDGNYNVESQGALVFEVLSARLMESYWQRIKSYMQDEPDSLEDLYKFYTRSTLWRGDLEKALLNDANFVKQQDWISHLNIAKVRLYEYGSWGKFHPLTLSHPLGRIPVIGKRFRFFEGPYSGGNETLMKSAHDLSAVKAPVNFGAQSRWMTDLSSLDENYFVFLGGQDGWLKSENTNDQTALWLEGHYLHIPFSKEAFLKSGVRKEF